MGNRGKRLCRAACRTFLHLRIEWIIRLCCAGPGKTEWATEENARAERLVALFRTCVLNGLYARAVQDQGKTQRDAEKLLEDTLKGADELLRGSVQVYYCLHE
jgi:hypothetical protein